MPSFMLFDDVVVARSDAATSGWTNFSALQTVFDYARNQGRPLFFQPGTYDSGTATILTSNGGGKPLLARAIPGSVTLRFNGANIFLRIEGQSNVRFQGLIFDGQNRALTDYVAQRPALIAVSAAAKAITFEDCRIVNYRGHRDLRLQARRERRAAQGEPGRKHGLVCRHHRRHVQLTRNTCAATSRAAPD